MLGKQSQLPSPTPHKKKTPQDKEGEGWHHVLSQARWAFLQLTQAEATWDFGLRGGGGGGNDVCGTKGDLPGGEMSEAG
jgi:hypothetical protein